MLVKVAHGVARPLLIFFEGLWWSGEASAGCKKVNDKGKKDNPRHDRPISLTVIPGKDMEQITLETIPKNMKDNKIFRSTQRGFMKRK